MQDRREAKSVAVTWPVYPGLSDYVRLVNEGVATYFSFWNLWLEIGRKCRSRSPGGGENRR